MLSFKPSKDISEIAKNLLQGKTYLSLILLVTFICRIVYVFYLSDYKELLFSDMGGYWERAKVRFDGDIFTVQQWGSWATFFHFYLALIFKILYFFKLDEYRLEAVLLMNILYSTISVLCFYLIAEHILKNRLQSLIATLFYSFSYPLIYFNAFLLTENLSIPLIVLSVFLLFKYNERIFLLFVLGLSMGLAVAFKPVIGLLCIPFLIYIVLVNKFSFVSLYRGMIFSFGVFLVVFLVLVENNYISKGELKSLAANGGVAFFFGQCKSSEVYSIHNGFHTIIAPPQFAGNPNHMKLMTDRPIYDQLYFYKLGLDCIKRDPWILVQDFQHLKGIFYNTLFPSVPSSKWFTTLIHVSNYMVIIMTLPLGLLYFLLRKQIVDIKKILLLLSIPFLLLLTMYFYGVEQRYFFQSYFVIYLLFFVVLFNLKLIKKEVVNYIRILVLAYLAYLFLR